LRLIWLLVLLAACMPVRLSMQERGPTRSVYVTNERTGYNFNKPETWDVFTLPDSAASFQVVDGEMVAQVAADRGYVLSRNHVEHTNVIINATLRQIDGLWGNGFGVVCRADEWGNGYYFLLSSNGEFTISVGTPARDELFELVPWQFHSAIHTGYAANEIRAVCVDDYLVMFINDVFVAETFDDELAQGELGLTVGAVGQPVVAQFDNVLVRGAVAY
jgi:hypothetical protein